MSGYLGVCAGACYAMGVVGGVWVSSTRWWCVTGDVGMWQEMGVGMAGAGGMWQRCGYVSGGWVAPARYSA
jgi:hypothetical protein